MRGRYRDLRVIKPAIEFRASPLFFFRDFPTLSLPYIFFSSSLSPSRWLSAYHCILHCLAEFGKRYAEVTFVASPARQVGEQSRGASKQADFASPSRGAPVRSPRSPFRPVPFRPVPFRSVPFRSRCSDRRASLRRTERLYGQCAE